jgi:hypothetical protein
MKGRTPLPHSESSFHACVNGFFPLSYRIEIPYEPFRLKSAVNKETKINKKLDVQDYPSTFYFFLFAFLFVSLFLFFPFPELYTLS